MCRKPAKLWASHVIRFTATKNSLKKAVLITLLIKADELQIQRTGLMRLQRKLLSNTHWINQPMASIAPIEELQKDLDDWIDYYNNERTHQGKMCCGRTPMETLLDVKTIWAEKNLAQI